MSKKFYIIICFLFLWKIDEYSSSANQQVAYGMEENQLILQSINSTVSNFGSDEEKKLYKRCIQHYVESQILYIESDYSKAYQRIRHTQKLLISLYESTLTKNIYMIRMELNRLGSISRGKEKTETIAFLRMGFRDIEEAEQKLIFAKNTRPYLYLLKLREMLFALKILKHSGRFVILLKLLHEADFPANINETDFENLRHEIERVISKDRNKYLTIHSDNFFKVLEGEGIYPNVWMKPDLEELSISMGNIDPAYSRRDQNLKEKK
ncbi:MAG: hypothetical protein L6Q54_01930 [Leptospiraceae bacterium]|nr:hypothetical protein [Leptospiraceae bacterium]MCK6379998.1 hypothetical protein [Leptospiraceae bacterium]NUM40159.1 hypothetical protein [Leptospiraceae bacterium]